MYCDQKAIVSKSNVASKPPLTSTGERAGSTTPAGGKPVDSRRRPSVGEEWVDSLIESDRRMARDPAYRKKVIDRMS